MYQKLRRVYTNYTEKIIETMADAINNISIPQRTTTANHGANESQQAAQQFPTVSFQAAQESSAGMHTTPSPPTRLLVLPPASSTSHGSALSSLASAGGFAVAADATPSTSNKRPASQSALPERIPRLPPNEFPDFNRAASDDNSVMSGEDETRWDAEGQKWLDITDDLALRDEEDAAAMDEGEGTIAEIHEWELNAEAAMADDGEQTSNLPPDEEVETQYEITTYTKKNTNAELREVAKVLLLPSGGTKDVLFTRIRDCDKPDMVTKIDAESFQVKKVVDAAASSTLPVWVLLTPEVAPTVSGVDMRTGAQPGFHAPTNTNNIAGAVLHNYLTSPDESIKRPAFRPKATSSAPINENGHPSLYAMEKLGLPENWNSVRPKDFFDLIIRPEFIEKVVVPCTNGRASSEGAGVICYDDYVSFDVDEINRFIGVMFANGLTPKPDFTMWFDSTQKHPLFGNDLIAPAMNKPLRWGGFIPGVRRWKHFKRFMCVYDYRDCHKPEAKSNPLWKIQRLLNELNAQSQKMWVTGMHLSVDEQTLGFKGRSGMKLRISYKKEGDGFQCDAICDNGYTYSFFFRHGDPPTLPQIFDHLKLPPTARRVVWLVLTLPNDWTRIYMDNLFNSQKLFTALYLAKALAHGVVRTSGRGLPPSVKQDEETNAVRAELLKGTTKAARLQNSLDCPDLLAVSVYDTKPVHLLSTVSDSVKWVQKSRKVWSQQHNTSQVMKFLRLNAIDDYNQNMNSTDISDQLRNVYRPDHWMRNRKWWWAFFIWAIGVAGVNAYKLYSEAYDIEAKKKKGGMPPKWSHCEFIVELVYDLIFPHKTQLHVDNLREMDDASFASSVRSTRSLSSFGRMSSTASSRNNNGEQDATFHCDTDKDRFLKDNKATTLTKIRMHSNYFKDRLDGKRHASLPCPGIRCQYCAYQYKHMLTDAERESRKHMKSNRDSSSCRRCLVCNVNLCPKCELEFHGISYDDLSKQYLNK